MAALAVSNFLRKLKAFRMDKVDTSISEELREVEKVFSLLLPHVQNAEWDELINREEEQEGRKSNDRVDISALNTWLWSVAVCAAEIEQIFIMYNFQYNLFNTPTIFYMKFLYSCHFKMDSKNVADKIRNCLLTLYRFTSPEMKELLWNLKSTVYCQNQQWSLRESAHMIGQAKVVKVSGGWLYAKEEEFLPINRSHQHQPVGNFLSNCFSYCSNFC